LQEIDLIQNRETTRDLEIEFKKASVIKALKLKEEYFNLNESKNE
jgi:hypothetical protein